MKLCNQWIHWERHWNLANYLYFARIGWTNQAYIIDGQCNHLNFDFPIGPIDSLAADNNADGFSKLNNAAKSSHSLADRIHSIKITFYSSNIYNLTLFTKHLTVKNEMIKRSNQANKWKFYALGVIGNGEIACVTFVLQCSGFCSVFSTKERSARRNASMNLYAFGMRKRS